MKKLLIVVCILILTFLVFYEVKYMDEMCFANKMITTQELASLEEGKISLTGQVSLVFNDYEMPYVREENREYYLLSQEGEDVYRGVLSTKDELNIAIVKPSVDKNTLMKSNTPLKVLLYDSNYYKEVDIFLTNLPVISLSSRDTTEGNSSGSLLVFDADGGTKENTYEIDKYNVRFHVRGNSSLYSLKNAYKVNVLDKKGDKKNVSLLGMRNDNDWILNPLYLDHSKMREKIGYDIWNLLSNKYHHSLEYVELVKDGEYLGLYYLAEPVDQKTFEASKKEPRITIDSPLSSLESGKSRDLTKEINKFKFESDYASEEEMIELAKSFMASYEDTKSKYNKNYKFEYDIDNNANYTLFINLILAIDNTYKNEKILLRSKNATEYLVQKCPWDLDWSLMNENVGNKNVSDEILEDEALSPQVKKSMEFKEAIKKKYLQARRMFYNEEYLNLLIDKYVEYLTQAGAVARENEKWSEFYANLYTITGNTTYLKEEIVSLESFARSVETIKAFFKDRIEILDEYYGGF